MSDWYQIENQVLTIQVVSKGAELKRLFNKVWNKELLWNGDDKIWSRSSPILFPIVGKLLDNEYMLDGHTYTMSQHGFARDSEFICIKCEQDSLEFFLGTSRDSYKIYPFIFELRVNYILNMNDLEVKIKVKNVDQKEMLFSIGAHPAFRTNPFSNYEVQFEKIESEYYLTKDGIINFSVPIPLKTKCLSLNNELFNNDALVFKKLKSKHVDLVNKKNREMIRIKNFEDNFFGIWAKQDIPFLSLEPWSGVNDQVGHDKELINKIGVKKLNPGEEYLFEYKIETSTWSPEGIN